MRKYTHIHTRYQPNIADKYENERKRINEKKLNV